ncbi:hypothetical protein BK004_04525 [bacterium CG10_46_32]|nr:MAG: hypothetical protein BK004_04525 [bacterium CG10_46_32]PIR55707.1 MAG: long-chain fatty acid--CoA ligase [Parcubacteria group bacterium CG10_big_fil_rev_8_21_14_0_10_46_32]
MKHNTIFEAFKGSVEKYPDNEALGWLVDGTYQTITYAELEEKVKQLAAGFNKHGLSQGDKLAFMVPNSPEWAMIDLACAQLGITDVPIHTTYGPEYITYITEHTGARWLIISQEFYQAYHKDIQELSVEKIIVVDASETKLDECDAAMPLKDLFVDGDIQKVDVKQDDIHTIIYTSGTTGKPKGVMLSHHNLLRNALGATEYIPVNPDDRFLSFLPLSHSLERTAGHYTPLLSGAAIYYAQDKRTMKDDILKARPTILVAVPRVFEKVYDAVQDKATHESGLKRWLFYKALDYGTKKRKGELSGLSQTIYNILDALVLKKIRASLGGRIKFTVSGGSALSPDIMQFFEDIGILIVEGYGLTETSPVVATNGVEDYRFGTVGKPIPGVEVKIAGDGEILVRGHCVMQGYYENDEATREAISSEGWFATGDLGALDKDGFLSITGRKKEMIVLSTGKNVAPVPIEQEMETNRFIAQALVYGDNQKHISGLIVPDFDELRRWAEEKGIEFHVSTILEREDVLKLYEHELHSQLNHFPEVEQIHNFRLIAEEFTQENDLLTPTLKLKRNKILEKYL